MSYTPTLPEWQQKYLVPWEPATVGKWSIEVNTFGENDMLVANSVSQLFSGRAIPPGTYRALRRNGTIVMSDTPAEIRDHVGVAAECKNRGGTLLINGLGLGMFPLWVARHTEVTHIDIVEIDPEVIELIGPQLLDAAQDTGTTIQIHEGDAYEIKWPAGKTWTVAWHDIWDTITADNLPEMGKLHRRYGRRTDWQWSWARSLCERARDQERRMYW